jgi:virginiamycin B lyase
MSEKQYASAPVESDNEVGVIPSSLSGVSFPHQQSPRRLSRSWRTFWLVLILLLPGIFIVFALTPGGISLWDPTNAIPPGTSAATGLRRAGLTPIIGSSVSVQAARIHTYIVSPPDAGLMLPAVDQRGNVWFGEMASNQLARLDPRTGMITTWTPPQGEDGIMGITIDTQGNIWFAEQNANYIGRFDPARQSFRTFSFGSGKSHRVGLQDLQFDASGRLWFTEMVAGRIGWLYPASGAFQTWVLPTSSSGTPLYPYGLAVTQDGQIWFGTFSGGVVGHLDPTTGRVLLYHLANPGEQIYSMAADGRGRIWYTELQFGKLGMIDAGTGKITELKVPTTLGNPEDLHSIVVANGDVWFTSSGANALVRYSPDDGTYTFFQLPVPGSVPFGLALASADTLWFTAGGNPANYVGEMTITS